MIEPEGIIQFPGFMLAIVLGTEAVLALLSPLFGMGWGLWTAYLVSATIALILSVRFVWSR